MPEKTDYHDLVPEFISKLCKNSLEQEILNLPHSNSSPIPRLSDNRPTRRMFLDRSKKMFMSTLITNYSIVRQRVFHQDHRSVKRVVCKRSTDDTRKAIRVFFTA
jgi:hypothetical protein